MNQCNFIGRTGEDPKRNQTTGGVSAMSFSVAVNERGKNGDHTEWVRVESYGKLAEALSWLRKGTLVAVTGKLRQRKYEKDGQTRYSTAILADAIHVLSPKTIGEKSEIADTTFAKPLREYAETQETMDDFSEIPF